MPTEYGNGGALGGVVGAVAGINVLRSILPSGVADGAAGGEGIWKIQSLRSAYLATAGVWRFSSTATLVGRLPGAVLAGILPVGIGPPSNAGVAVRMSRS